MVRYFFLLLVVLGLFASVSETKAGSHFGPPRRGSPGGVAYSEYHHRPYYYRRYHYAPVHHSPRGRSNRFPHR